MQYLSTQFFMRYASKQFKNNYQIQSWTMNAFLRTFEAKKSISLNSKSGRRILHALKINKQYS